MKLWTKQGRGVVLDFSWRGGVDLDFFVSFRGLSPCAAERGGREIDSFWLFWGGFLDSWLAWPVWRSGAWYES